MADHVHYVYAIVPAATDVSSAPAGIDDAPVGVIAAADVAALTSRVEAGYAAGVEERLADVAWLAPRAVAHDRVVVWASDAGAVVPLPVFSLFRTEAAVRAMLAERGAELASLLREMGRGREYGIRVFRIDDELRRSLADHSPAIAKMEHDVAATTAPGQSFLLARKLDAARKDELHRVAAAVAAGAYDAFARRSLAAAQDASPAAGGDRGAAILDASFLVAHEGIDDFRAAVTAFVREHEGRGFRVEFTGPWPPYHFTRGGAGRSPGSQGT